MLKSKSTGFTDPKAQEALERQVADFKARVAQFEKDPKKPEDSMDAIQERANHAAEGRELANRRLEHYEVGSGLLPDRDRPRVSGNHHGHRGPHVAERCTRRCRRCFDDVRVFRSERDHIHKLD